MTRPASPQSAYTVSSSGSEEDYEPSPPSKRRKLGLASARPRVSKPAPKRPTKSTKPTGQIDDIEDMASIIPRLHSASYHRVDAVASMQQDLLAWFEGVREKRGMPWRKRYDAGMSLEDKGQRAYEIWVSEVMLQQTQVATVIDYWRRWMERWPTIAELAKADVEEVNAAWRGLGYYRRARSLLKGAQTVMGNEKFKGRLPREPLVMEKEIDGVGRYTAGAITSMAYGMRTPVVDGNVHRLFTRLLGVHAVQTSPATIKFLWNAADQLIDSLPEEKGVAGDWNQALMELGSQICKPVAPDCPACPVRSVCKAYQELTASPNLEPATPECDLCSAVEGTSERIPSVTVFPMKKEKKASREENEVVCIVEWTGGSTSEENGTSRKWLFTKRPETGLLAGLFEPPTTRVPLGSTEASRTQASFKRVSDLVPGVGDCSEIKSETFGSILHIFSHINMTYHIVRLQIQSANPPAVRDGVWLDLGEVERANVGTGVKKVWSQVYGRWGSLDADPDLDPDPDHHDNGGRKKAVTVEAKRPRRRKDANKVSAPETQPVGGGGGDKMVKKVMMPLMPVRKAKGNAASDA